MGANHPGEIAALCRIARPDFGIITNIGKAHLEGFGSFEGVVKAKSELYDFIRHNNGLVFVNLDNQLLRKAFRRNENYQLMERRKCRLQRHDKCRRNPYLAISWSAGQHNGFINTRLYGDYNFENVMAAVCIGLYFGISPEQIENAISAYITG